MLSLFRNNLFWFVGYIAYDLYNNTKLWWVFAQRNMDVIKDPIYDLVAGIKIYIPQGPKLRQALGI